MNHRALSGGRFRGFSAGSRPTGHVHPLALEVLREQHQTDFEVLLAKHLERQRVHVARRTAARAEAAEPMRARWFMAQPQPPTLQVQIKSTLNGVPITNKLPRPCIEVVTPGQEDLQPFSLVESCRASTFSEPHTRCLYIRIIVAGDPQSRCRARCVAPSGGHVARTRLGVTAGPRIRRKHEDALDSDRQRASDDPRRRADGWTAASGPRRGACGSAASQ